MKVSRDQLNKIIISEFYGAGVDAFEDPAPGTTLAAKAEIAEAFVKKNSRKVRKLVRKLLKGGRQARKVINDPEARALLGAAMRHGKGINRSLGKLDSSFRLLDKIKEYSRLVDSGVLTPARAKILLQKSFGRGVIKFVFGIIGAGVGTASGLLGFLSLGLVKTISDTLIEPFNQDIEEIHENLRATYEAIKWTEIARKDPELNAILSRRTLSKEIEKGTQSLEAPLASASPVQTTSQALAARDVDSLSSAGTIAKIEMEPVKLAMPRRIVSMRSGARQPAAVMLIQRALKEIDVWPGSIDGEFSEELRQTIEQFQRSEKLSADGVYGPDTRRAIQKRLQARGMDIRLAEHKIKTMSKTELKKIIYSKYSKRLNLEA